MVGTPSAGSPNTDRRHDRQSDDAQVPTGRPGNKRSPSRSSSERERAEREHEVLHLPELADEQHRPFEEIVSAAGNAEQAWQLGHHDRQPGAGLEAHQDTVADQPHQHAEPQQPCDQAKQRPP